MNLEYKDVPMKVFNRYAKCILCGGEYRSTGVICLSDPPQYPHRCDKCNHTINLDECYPKIVFVEEQSRKVAQENEAMKKYICVAKCPELDFDNSKHCVTDNPNNPFSPYDYDCPCGNCPIWEELTDHSTEKENNNV